MEDVITAPSHFELRARRWVPPTFALLALAMGVGSGMLVARVESSARLIVIAMGVIALVATVSQAEWGLLVLVFITWTRFSDIAIEYHGAPSIAKSFVVLLAFALALRWVVYGERPRGWQRPALMVGAYAVVGVASLLYAADPSRSQSALSDLLKDGLIAVMVTMLLQRMSHLRAVIWTLLVCGLFLGGLSVYQYLTGTFGNAYGGFAQAEVLNIIGEYNSDRVSGPIGDPNFYAQIMLVLVPLALDRFWSEPRASLRLLAGVVMAVCLLTVALTYSRGAFLALVIMLAVMLLYRPPRPREWITVLVLGLLLWQFIPSAYTARIQTLVNFLPGQSAGTVDESSLRGRASEAGVAWLMFLDHPIIGVGLGNYPVYYQEYSRQLGIDPRAEERKPHSLYLEVAAETGLVGLMVFGLLLRGLATKVLDAWTAFARAGDPRASQMVVALGASLLGYLVAAVFIHAAYPRYFWLLAGIALSLPQVMRHELGARPDRAPTLMPLEGGPAQ